MVHISFVELLADWRSKYVCSICIL